MGGGGGSVLRLILKLEEPPRMWPPFSTHALSPLALPCFDVRDRSFNINGDGLKKRTLKPSQSLSASGTAANPGKLPTPTMSRRCCRPRTKLNQIPIIRHSHVEPSNFLVLSMVSVAFIAVVLGLSGALFCMRHHSHYKLKERLASLGTDTSNDATAAYQDLCRQRMAIQTSERGSEVFHPTHTHTSRINSVSSQFSDGATQSPSARSSTSSWSEEPHSNMDISTGHMILVHTHMQ
ncbi:hypothetical protein SRHO_G00031780 [Serrasalmus rhombeus]